MLRIVKPIYDEVLINEFVPIYGKNNNYIAKRGSNKTKYESTNGYQLIAYVAYLF